MRQDLPVGTVTFVFTDIEGSTRLLEELGSERYGELLVQHHRVCRATWLQHGGVEVDTAGDAFFVVFPAASGALAAADEAQQALAELGLRVRMGVHTGEVSVNETGYVGFELHRAARIAAAAHGGQVVVSGATAAAAAVDGLIELGEHRFKDLDEPVVIFQLGDGAFPPLKTLSNTNLPRPASSFVGRERELSDVLARFERGARLVTLTGPGGSGKTRLALEAAATLVPGFKAGLFWVGLASLRDSTLVTETIAQTLGAKDGLAAHIGERELLLLLDNLEQVIEAAPELAALLHACPNLRLLVTSRELLRVDGEVEYAVPPLAEPEAVDLFCERAQTEPSDEIQELCARLDNLPLAVELAAARTKALSPAQILERLSQRLDLLKGRRDADPRQQTLRATIEWSHDLLSDEEQRLFRRLSVFAGGCTLEAAEQVADADIDTLQSLVEKSLIRFTSERYWMLETIREYASERAGSSDLSTLRDRHAAWLLDLVQGLGSGLRRMNPEAVARVVPEHANLRDAIVWSSTDGSRAVADELVARLCSYWISAGMGEEGRILAEGSLRAEPAGTDAARIGGVIALAELCGWTGDVERAIELREQVLGMIAELGDEPIPGPSGGYMTKDRAATLVLKDLSQSHALGGDLEIARTYADDAIVRAKRLGNDGLVATCAYAKGVVEFYANRFTEARVFFEDTLPIYNELPSVVDLGAARLMIGECLRRESRPSDALLELRAGLELLLAVGDQPGVHEALQEIAAVAAVRGQPEGAAALLGCSERLRTATGVPLWDADDHERTIDALRNQLGDAFETHRARGAALTDEEAYALARSIT